MNHSSIQPPSFEEYLYALQRHYNIKEKTLKN